MKILITGVSGTGKSTIAKALKERGINAIDFADIPNLCYWRDKTTKERVEYITSEDADLLNSRERVCDIDKMNEILNQYEDLIMTGVASNNQDEYFGLFDKVLLLQCNPETFVHRLKTRASVFGKTQTEQNFIVEWQKWFDPKLISQGAIPINTEDSFDQTLNKILSEISLH